MATPFDKPIQAPLRDLRSPMPVEDIERTSQKQEGRYLKAKEMESKLSDILDQTDPESLVAEEDKQLARSILDDAYGTIDELVEEGRYSDADIALADLGRQVSRDLGAIQQVPVAMQKSISTIDESDQPESVKNYLRSRVQQAAEKGSLREDDRGIIRADTGEISAAGQAPEYYDYLSLADEFVQEIETQEHPVGLGPIRNTNSGISQMLSSMGVLEGGSVTRRDPETIQAALTQRLLADSKAVQQMSLELESMGVDPNATTIVEVRNRDASPEDIRKDRDTEEVEISALESYAMDQVQPHVTQKQTFKQKSKIHNLSSALNSLQSQGEREGFDPSPTMPVTFPKNRGDSLTEIDNMRKETYVRLENSAKKVTDQLKDVESRINEDPSKNVDLSEYVDLRWNSDDMSMTINYKGFPEDLEGEDIRKLDARLLNIKSQSAHLKSLNKKIQNVEKELGINMSDLKSEITDKVQGMKEAVEIMERVPLSFGSTGTSPRKLNVGGVDVRLETPQGELTNFRDLLKGVNEGEILEDDLINHLTNLYIDKKVEDEKLPNVGWTGIQTPLYLFDDPSERVSAMSKAYGDQIQTGAQDSFWMEGEKRPADRSELVDKELDFQGVTTDGEGTYMVYSVENEGNIATRIQNREGYNILAELGEISQVGVGLYHQLENGSQYGYMEGWGIDPEALEANGYTVREEDGTVYPTRFDVRSATPQDFPSENVGDRIYTSYVIEEPTGEAHLIEGGMIQVVQWYEDNVLKPLSNR